MATPTVGREWHLTARPYGWPTPADFALREAEIPAPGAGQVLVRNLYLSVDPYMRRRMDDVESYVPPFKLDQPMDGGAIGVVTESNSDSRAVGDHVLHMLGWREYAVLDAGDTTPVDADAAPLSAYLGALGTTGLTAYAGLLHVAAVKLSTTATAPSSTSSGRRRPTASTSTSTTSAVNTWRRRSVCSPCTAARCYAG